MDDEVFSEDGGSDPVRLAAMRALTKMAGEAGNSRVSDETSLAMCKLLLQASVDNCPEVRGHMAGFCRSAADGTLLDPTPSCLSRCVASAVFNLIPESTSVRLTVAGLALVEVLQEEELGEVRRLAKSTN